LCDVTSIFARAVNSPDIATLNSKKEDLIQTSPAL